ncbi:4-diphosphocytidyl-2-C-methyl-D-erythritolkinase [Desulfurobacterium thermolithotrophum DSM 11699]|uniref:4-diphosphocytidyl-2-C-methyl-D-erythritol kinase n=1 Tax=Desulfurobacterium thermolithotrophum (strain DSM 11699 / BSA) TaxID=868864 RepID=F0S1Y9_DESTD|nr:4-(cytidine 5'-diphospho)-2-C-methyl-D-erythritol kinase [Desulfurobacterium thermolithotrophum]ADY74070.1 4-diphosphocytidyl-2-C-methyl-D-erythritolkinase [Desulfurobacterium thermolithotrophum DSM 11699]
MKLILPSPAKINLSLWVKGKRVDGYHEIITVMHTINLMDIISLLPSNRLELSIKGNSSLPLDKSNLIIKACKLFQEATGIKPKVKIKLEKKIPVGAGLGGGSSNAATTLKGLNLMYDKPLSDEKLQEIAAELGSDVPFFLKGGLAIAYGRGEKLKHYTKSDFKILLIYPGFSCLTKEVYENLPSIIRTEITVEAAERLIVSPLINGKFEEVENNMENDLELSNSPCVKRVLKIKEQLVKFGLKPLMSGSGSSIFSIIKDENFDVTPLKKEGYWFKFLSAI